MRRSFRVVLAVAAGFALASCGEAEPASTAASPAPTVGLSAEPSPEGLASAVPPVAAAPEVPPAEQLAAKKVVADYLVALVAKNAAQACTFLTDDYVAKSVEESVALGVDPDADCATAIAVGIETIAERKLTTANFVIGTPTSANGQVRVPVNAPDGFADTTYQLVRSGVSWKIDGDSGTS